jgi:hypothetical protein
MAIVFPCPNCGATQSVNDDETSTQCQFCGNSITVPEALRPKNAAPAPTPAMPQAIPYAGLTGFPGLSGLPVNLDINKLRDLGHAIRSGDRNQAAQIYQAIFGVDAAQAQQMVDAMLAHHGATFRMNLPPVIQMGGAPPVMQIGNPPPAQWLPLLRRIQDAGKFVAIWASPGDAQIALGQLDQRRLCLRVHCECEQQAREFLAAYDS